MIRPLRDYLVLRPFGKKPGMVGHLHMPETGTLATATSCLCRVVAAGPKSETVKKDDVVHVKCYGAYPAGILVVHEGQNLVMLREREINGVVLDPPPSAEDVPWGVRSDWDISVRQEEEHL